VVRACPDEGASWNARPLPSHAVGQTLHVTEGIGLVTTRDGTVIRITAGDTVWTPPGEEHWHGATSDNMMCHFALLEHYNTQRRHSALGGLPPISRLLPT
jgi:quercetin dioxygenase-like cupin family protein